MTEFVLPETRYAISGDVNIAYQVMGDGPVDIIVVPGIISHVEFLHELRGYSAFMRRLSTFTRVVAFDKRGQGLSDRVAGAPSLEQRMDDVRAIMDSIGSAQTALLGVSEGCAMSVMFAATYPERVSKLILFGGYRRRRDLPGDVEQGAMQLIKSWGAGTMINRIAPSLATDPAAVAQFAKYERLSASPGAIGQFALLNASIDVSSLLDSVRAPTLVLHRRGDVQVPVEHGRDLAAGIPGARFIEYPGDDHSPYFGFSDREELLGDIEEFMTGHRDSAPEDIDRVLATVLFTDIVDSTRRAAETGDRVWRKLLDSHDELASLIVEKHRGILIKSTGDGILATFDGPARGVRCALALGAAAKQIGLPIRAGLHTGEIELRGRDIGGVAVHTASRVMTQSQPDEVLVSRVVTDLVAGAGLTFAGRGSHELKGLPGRWDLFAASI
ncbi:adenylate/guanylate cyclase domain-containing protein [Bradyrhizobium sp. 187]|uniref:adenylate/guanylate cyclase domain-containing protein n=1 Tax=Bradyrhizobium sp. 187 TaxID=2782655 RepID=UPI001FFFBEBE|nr:adenylate/guanylate cyclase domain-containing protein [Bradyrhizobium sp. 187]UPJ76153.1 adenylate/guanylate cyclase domain-containing protein [Bradyrhizobium sp. 187]